MRHKVTESSCLLRTDYTGTGQRESAGVEWREQKAGKRPSGFLTPPSLGCPRHGIKLSVKWWSKCLYPHEHKARLFPWQPRSKYGAKSRPGHTEGCASDGMRKPRTLRVSSNMCFGGETITPVKWRVKSLTTKGRLFKAWMENATMGLLPS